LTKTGAPPANSCKKFVRKYPHFIANVMLLFESMRNIIVFFLMAHTKITLQERQICYCYYILLFYTKIHRKTEQTMTFPGFTSTGSILFIHRQMLQDLFITLDVIMSSDCDFSPLVCLIGLPSFKNPV
jgi:hypothetical protein